MLWLYQRTVFGKLDNPANATLTDLDPREVATLLPLTVLCFWIGLYPAPFFRVLEAPVDKLVRQVDKTWTYPAAIADLAPRSAAPVASGGAASAR